MAKPVKKEIPDELVVELSRTITMGSGDDSTTYNEIRLKEPNVYQLSQFIKKSQKENAVDSMKYLISMVSAVPAQVIDKISVREFYRAQDYMMLFITPPDEDDPEGNAEGSQQTGS